MIFTLIQTKFDIDISNDELLEPFENVRKKKSWLSLVMHKNTKPKSIWYDRIPM
jgi:hypothetical protein